MTKLNNPRTKECNYCGDYFAQVYATKSFCSQFCRFWAKVSYGKNCWEWNAGKDPKGYGQFENKHAHRTAWLYTYQTNLDDPTIFVCHKCDNTGCVKLSHLWLGSASENNKDTQKKKRGAIGERNGRAKLSNNDVLAIRQSSLPYLVLSCRYGVTEFHIYQIRSRRCWKHI